MSKKLNSTAIANELKGNSGFFQKQPEVTEPNRVYSSPVNTASVDDTVIPRHHDTTTPSVQPTVEKVRRAVKEIGKEAATHRFTFTEKKALMEIIYRYKQQGISTSENEITRIAINYLIEDFNENADQSFLAQVIKEINA